MKKKKFAKKVLAGIMSLALAASVLPSAVLPTAVQAAEAKHIFVDWGNGTWENGSWKDARPATEGSIVVYANGGNVKINDDGDKFNFKQSKVYTNILGSYKYDYNADRKKLTTMTGKVIVITSTSQDYKEGYEESKKKYDTKNEAIKTASSIAKASIKNGEITVSAGSESGTVYLHVVDTANPFVDGHHDTVPVTVLASAAKIALTTGSAVDVTKDISKKKVTRAITKTSLNVDDSVTVYANPMYTKENNKIATGSTITAELSENSKEYFKIECVDTKNYGYKITCLKTKGDGKTCSGRVTFTCKESGKKATLSLTGVSQLKTIAAKAEAKEGVTVTNDTTITVKATTSASITAAYTMDVTDTKKPGEKTTDKLKVSAVYKDAVADWNSKGTALGTTNRVSGTTYPSVTLSTKDNKLTVKVPKNCKAGTYCVMVYTSWGRTGATKTLTINVG